jgi:hypothetical protein
MKTLKLFGRNLLVCAGAGAALAIVGVVVVSATMRFGAWVGESIFVCIVIATMCAVFAWLEAHSS